MKIAFPIVVLKWLVCLNIKRARSWMHNKENMKYVFVVLFDILISLFSNLHFPLFFFFSFLGQSLWHRRKRRKGRT